MKKQANQYSFAGSKKTTAEIAEATGVSASKLRFQLGRGGCKTVNQAFKKIGLDEAQQAKVEELTGKAFKPAKAETTGTRGRPALEEQSVVVNIKSGKYTIVRRAEDTEAYKKHTIDVFTVGSEGENDKKVDSAKKILKEVIAEHKLEVEVEGKNTRTIGKKVIEALSK